MPPFRYLLRRTGAERAMALALAPCCHVSAARPQFRGFMEAAPILAKVMQGNRGGRRGASSVLRPGSECYDEPLSLSDWSSMDTDEFRLMKEYAARDYLQHIRDLEKHTAALRAHVDETRELALPGGIDYGAMVASGGIVNKDGVPNAVIKLQEAVSEYCAELAGYVDEMDEANRCLQRLESPVQRDVLRLYYLAAAKSWEEVAQKLFYSKMQVLRIKSAALVSLYDVMPLKWKIPVHRAV